MWLLEEILKMPEYCANLNVNIFIILQLMNSDRKLKKFTTTCLILREIYNSVFSKYLKKA
jgi:hypothetical protein